MLKILTSKGSTVHQDNLPLSGTSGKERGMGQYSKVAQFHLQIGEDIDTVISQ